MEIDQRKQTMERQPLWATVGLAVVSVGGLAAMVIVRVYTDEVPIGISNITTAAITGLASAAMRRRV